MQGALNFVFVNVCQTDGEVGGEAWACLAVVLVVLCTGRSHRT